MSSENGFHPPRNDIQYSYQRGSRYQPFIDQGVAPSLEESSLCWLACLDMVFSGYLTDPEARFQVLSDVVERVKSEEMMGKKGQLYVFDDYYAKFVGIVTETVQKAALPMQVRSTDACVNELVPEVDQGGAMVIFALQREYMSHAMVMDGVEKDDAGSVVAISYLNPYRVTEEEARGVVRLSPVPERNKVGMISVFEEKIVFTPDLYTTVVTSGTEPLLMLQSGAEQAHEGMGLASRGAFIVELSG